MKKNKKTIRIFELKKDLYITEDNYEEFAKAFDTALAKNLDRFPFRNDKGKLYAIETEFVKFVLEYLEKADHEDLIKKANDYKVQEEKLTKEEFEEKQAQILKDHQEAEKARKEKPKLYTFDGLIANKLKDKDIKKNK
jgi:virulence-associated protein VapD